MDINFARALLSWHRDATEIVKICRGEVKRLVLISGISPAILAALIERWGPAILHVLPEGAALEQSCLLAECRRAQATLSRFAVTELLPSPDNEMLITERSTVTTDQDDLPPPFLPLKPAKSKRRQHGSIPWTVCDPAHAAERLKSASDKQTERKHLLNHFSQKSVRGLPKVTTAHIDSVRRLVDDFPNFQPVIRILVRHLSLLRRVSGALQLPPLLLVGEPGIGKTEFARRLAEVLGMSSPVYSLAEVTASFVITGSTRSWSEAAAGLVAKAIAELDDNKPLLIIFDELDKVDPRQSYPPDRALLGLLEPQTAARFRDEYLDLLLNVEPVSWLLTANRLEGIRPEILSRLQVVEIRSPTLEQMPAVVRSIDHSLRQRMPMLARTFTPLDADCLSALSRCSPRAVTKILREAYGLASECASSSRGRIQLKSQHLKAAAENLKPIVASGGFQQPFGFITSQSSTTLPVLQPVITQRERLTA